MSEMSSGAPASTPPSTSPSSEAATTKEVVGKVSAKAEAAKAKSAGTAQANMSQGGSSGESAINDALAAQGLETEESSDKGEELESEQVADSEETEEAPKEKEKKAEPKKFKIKVDGKEETLSEEEMVRRVQKATKAEKSIQEASELKKGITEFLKEIQENPKKILKELGIDPIDFSRKTIEAELEEEAKSPEQKELEMARKELEEVRASQKAAEEQRKAQEWEDTLKQTETDLENDITDAIDTSGLRKSPALLKKVADIMLVNLQHMERNPKAKMINAKEAVKIARLELTSDLKELLGNSDDDLLEQFLGDDVIKRVRKRAISKVKTTIPSSSGVKQSGNAPMVNAPKVKINIKDFMKLK